MIEITKIEDKSLNLDVQGQGCWDDCYHGAYWSQLTSTSSTGCIWNSPYYDCRTTCFL